jgi:hypothetical protein
MRRIRLIPALLVFLLSACNENLIDTHLPAGEGEVVFDLSADERVEIVSAKSGSSSELPETQPIFCTPFSSGRLSSKQAAFALIRSVLIVAFSLKEKTINLIFLFVKLIYAISFCLVLFLVLAVT